MVRTKKALYRSLALVLLVGAVCAGLLGRPGSWGNDGEKPREAVSNSAWDGSVRQVEDWLRENLKDPDSLRSVEWSPVVKAGGERLVRVKYRAKNSFGAYVVENRIFRLDERGAVVSVTDWK